MLKIQKIRNLQLFSTQINRKQAAGWEFRHMLRRAFDGVLGPMMQPLVENLLGEKTMDILVTVLNQWGDPFVSHASLMFLQVSGLIVLVWLLDCIFYRHLRASLRYGLWMLILGKLILTQREIT